LNKPTPDGAVETERNFRICAWIAAGGATRAASTTTTVRAGAGALGAVVAVNRPANHKIRLGKQTQRLSAKDKLKIFLHLSPPSL
jgi:hypothetical protein